MGEPLKDITFWNTSIHSIKPSKKFSNTISLLNSVEPDGKENKVLDKAGEEEDFVEHLYPTNKFGTSSQDLHEDGAIQGGSLQYKKVGG